MQKLLVGLISSLTAITIASGLVAVYYNPVRNKHEEQYLKTISSFDKSESIDNSEIDGGSSDGSFNGEFNGENIYSVNDDLLEVFKEKYAAYVNRRKRWRENGTINLVSAASSFEYQSMNNTHNINNRCVEEIRDSEGKIIACFTTNWRFIGEKPKVGVIDIKNYPWEHWWNNYGHKGRLMVYLSPQKTTVIVKGESDEPVPIEKKEDVEDILRPCFSGNDYDIDNAQRVIEEEGKISNLESVIFMADLLSSCPQIKDHYCRTEHHDFEEYCLDTKKFLDKPIKQQP